ncbi:capsular exopolysaccharide biosynthesis protein [Thermoanaerobacter kivui]|uniref:non-specific protein-tyrosine kinase n=1 Tax=Thermoanaerobacter kivui TaxID=2325 RepID=A0A097APZ5_THEKI|nr:CpsD/CapB family tyrosine-protein kinase [Thermoanaerobacter kivui]AIS51904.1 capsular exopolysaccharide biosynthesis protein [Thermoanaerobacter kivui]
MVAARNLIVADPKSPFAEAFRALRTNLQFTSVDKKVKSILITSSLPNEGKSTVVKNLAYSVALTGSKVIVIDADLRNPTVHKLLYLPNSRGLTNLLIDEGDYEAYLNIDNSYSNLHILTSGPIPPNPAELLGSNKMKKLLSNIQKDYDYVFIDSPPVVTVTDAVVLAPVVDGIILVIQAGKTEIEAVSRAKEILESVKANILGVVLNRVKESHKGYYYYYYYYDDNNPQHKKRRKR